MWKGCEYCRFQWAAKWTDLFTFSMSLICILLCCVTISCLKNFVGITDVALNWFISYLSGLSLLCLEMPPLFRGVPQGSILGSLLFTVYMLPRGPIMCRHKTDFHCYTDDTQLYVQIKSGTINVSFFISWLSEIKNWISKNVVFVVIVLNHFNMFNHLYVGLCLLLFFVCYRIKLFLNAVILFVCVAVFLPPMVH